MTVDGTMNPPVRHSLTLTETGRIMLDPTGPVTTAALLPLRKALVHSDPAVAGHILAVDLGGGSDDEGSVPVLDWLTALIGPEGYERLRPGLSQQIPDEITDVQFVPGTAWQYVWRLSLLLWLERWSWVPLDEQLLNAEVGLLAAGLDLPGADRLAEQRLQRAIPTLKEMAVRLEAGRLPTDLASALATSVRGAAAHYLNPDLIARLSASVPTKTSPVAAPDLGQQRLLSGSRVAVHWGADDAEAPLRRTSSVDWAQVPHGILDTEDDTVSVTYDSSTRTMTVQVRAAAGAAAYPWLRFRAVDPASSGPFAVDAPLTLVPAEGVYRGAGSLHPRTATPAGLVVDVYSVHSSVPPRVRNWQQSLLAAQRHASRALVTTRLALASSRDAAAQLFDLAEEHWELAATSLDELASGPDAGQVPRLDNLRASCLQQRKACIQQVPELADDVSYLDEQLSDLPSVPVPRLNAPAARPVLAELAWAYGNGQEP